MTFNDIRYFIPPNKINSTNTAYLNEITAGCADFVANYTNQTIDTDTSKGLLQIVADMVVFEYTSRPELSEMTSEDMTLAFNTEFPDGIKTRLNQYRKLKW